MRNGDTQVAQVHGGEGGHLAQRTLKVLDAAEDEAQKLKDEPELLQSA